MGFNWQGAAQGLLSGVSQGADKYGEWQMKLAEQAAQDARDQRRSQAELAKAMALENYKRQLDAGKPTQLEQQHKFLVDTYGEEKGNEMFARANKMVPDEKDTRGAVGKEIDELTKAYGPEKALQMVATKYRGQAEPGLLAEAAGLNLRGQDKIDYVMGARGLERGDDGSLRRTKTKDASEKPDFTPKDAATIYQKALKSELDRYGDPITGKIKPDDEVKAMEAARQQSITLTGIDPLTRKRVDAAGGNQPTRPLDSIWSNR